MKKSLFSLLLCAFAMSATAQTTPTIDELTDSLLSLYKEAQYTSAINLADEIEAQLDTATRADKDSLFCTLQVFKGKSYYRKNQSQKAIDALDRGIQRWESKIGKKGDQYAFMLDNQGLYYISVGDSVSSQKGLQRTLQALNVINDIPDKAVSSDMQGVLCHIAEAYSDVKMPKDAIVYEIRCLNICEKLNGKHSEEYINELPYLSKYYLEAGDTVNADKTDLDKETLKNEYDKGQRDLPNADQRDFTSAEVCHKYSYEALRCADFYLNHLITSNYMDQCRVYLMNWVVASPDIKINAPESYAKLLKDKNGLPYFVAYIAGCVKYSIENEEKEYSPLMHYSATIDMLNFYINNKELTGKVKSLDKAISLYNKSEDALVNYIVEQYPKEDNNEK